MPIDPKRLGGRFALWRLPEHIRYVVEKVEGCWLAGGALRSLWTGEPVADWDLFFRDEDSVFACIEKLTGLGAYITFRCPAGELVTLKDPLFAQPIQLICRNFYATPMDTVDQFDFTACCAFWDGREAQWLTPEYAEDAETRSLRLHRVVAPIATLRRLKKYEAHGYYGRHIPEAVFTWVAANPEQEYDFTFYID